MRYCLPFLATDLSQFDPDWAEQDLAVEAVVFDAEDLLEAERWALVRRNLAEVAVRMPPGRLLFHFPVNRANYVEDEAVRRRLWQCFELAAQFGVAGVVLHSNQIRPVEDWTPDLAVRTRDRFAEFCVHLRDRLRDAPFWVGLENMPIMGNYGRELDPTLVFPSDFEGLCGGQLRITWDLCHYSYTMYVVEQLRAGVLDERERRAYPSLREHGLFDFLDLAPDIVHWHFSAFRGLARTQPGPDGRRERCHEGQTPWAASVPESTYAQLLAAMRGLPHVQQVTFEVAEDDYRNRVNTRAVMRWCDAQPSAPSPAPASPSRS